MTYCNFESVYDKYCAMLFGISLKICHSKEKADELLMTTFKKIKEEDISQEKYPAYCITLVRLVIKTAQQLYPDKMQSSFKLKQFEKTPLLNNLICDKISLAEYCKEENLTQQEGSQIIRKEFNKIRNAEKENKVFSDNL